MESHSKSTFMILPQMHPVHTYMPSQTTYKTKKCSQNDPTCGLMLQKCLWGEQVAVSPCFPFMAKISILSEDKPDEAVCQALVPPDSTPPGSCPRGPAKFSLPEFQGNQDSDGKICAHSNQTQYLKWCSVCINAR